MCWTTTTTLFSLSVATCHANYIPQRQNHTVDLGYVQYGGALDQQSSTITYYGIKYAAPPVGERRWRSPIDIEQLNDYNSDQIINATVPGHQCYQTSPSWIYHLAEPLRSLYLPDNTDSDEDCLHLDVSVPSNPSSPKLPVMIQIHGGGWNNGRSTLYPGTDLIETSNGGLIYVQIQYRLGVHGFLSGNTVQEDGTGNAGLLDQRAAINWVQRNIHAFGGDPTKVTLNGGSAGGGSVMDQMIMYGGVPNPPFRAAISEYPGVLSHHNGTILEAQYRQLLDATDCSSLSCLRGVSSDALLKAANYSMTVGYEQQLYGHGDFYYSPSVDGVVIRDLPSNELKHGHFSKVPLLTDRDGYEGLLFANFSITLPSEVERDTRRLFPSAKASFLTRLLDLYPATDYTGSYFNDSVFSSPTAKLLNSAYPTFARNSEFHRMASIWGDFAINCPSTYMATSSADAGQPVWKMEFFAGTQLHGATVPYLYPRPSPPDNTTLAAVMKDYFVSFALALDPNMASSLNLTKPFWPRYSSNSLDEAFNVLRIDHTDIGVRPDTDISRKCDFFSSHAESIPY